MPCCCRIIGARCDIETISGGCDCDTHQRRMRTKLISMAMRGFDRVVIEPSGIFDVDEFYDILRDEPLDRWYALGNVVAIVDARLEDTLSRRQSICWPGGCQRRLVVMSRAQQASARAGRGGGCASESRAGSLPLPPPLR